MIILAADTCSPTAFRSTLYPSSIVYHQVWKYTEGSDAHNVHNAPSTTPARTIRSSSLDTSSLTLVLPNDTTTMTEGLQYLSIFKQRQLCTGDYVHAPCACQITSKDIITHLPHLQFTETLAYFEQIRMRSELSRQCQGAV
jgi:hypothetical protein